MKQASNRGSPSSFSNSGHHQGSHCRWPWLSEDWVWSEFLQFKSRERERDREGEKKCICDCLSRYPVPARIIFFLNYWRSICFEEF